MTREIVRAVVAGAALTAVVAAIYLWAPVLGPDDDEPRLIPWNPTDQEYEAHVAREMAKIRGARGDQP